MKTLNQKELKQIDGGRNSNTIDYYYLLISFGICPTTGCFTPANS